MSRPGMMADERGFRYAGSRGWMTRACVAGGAAIIAFFCISLAVWPHPGSVPLDDSYIHFTFARNLSEGSGFSFTPGRSTPGSTAPLWTVLLALQYGLTGSMAFGAKALSAVLFLLTVLCVFRLVLFMTGDFPASFCASLLTVLAGRFAWGCFSGMEVPLFSALSVAALYVYVKAGRPLFRNPWCTVLAAMAALSRPEGLLLFGIIWVDSLLGIIALRPSGGERLRCLAKMLYPLLLFSLLVAPAAAFTFETTGRFFPNTFYAKTASLTVFGFDTVRYLLQLGWFFFDNPFLAPFFLFAVFLAFRRADSVRERGIRVIAAWVVVLPLLHALVTPVLVPRGRYDIPVIPLYVAVSACGLFSATFFRSGRGRSLRHLVVILAAVYGVFSLSFWAVKYGRDCRSIDRLDVAMAGWVRENLPAGSAVAVDDVGAMGYLTESSVIDLHGLITPEVFELYTEEDISAGRTALERIRRRDEIAGRYLRRIRPDALVVFPRWHPGLFGLGERLEVLHRISFGGNTICAYDELVAYRMNWDEDG